MTEHRVAMLGSLRRFEDPAHSADPRIRAIVTGLATLEVAPPPRAHFRAELRAQLVAVAPRLVAEGLSAEATPVPPGAIAEKAASPARVPAEPGAVRRALSRLAVVKPGRPLGIITAAVAVLGLLLGGAAWISRHALPGDALYGLKRADENLELATASSPTDKTSDLMSFAHTRANEVSELLVEDRGGSSGPVGSDTAGLVTTTLGSAEYLANWPGAWAGSPWVSYCFRVMWNFGYSSLNCWTATLAPSRM